MSLYNNKKQEKEFNLHKPKQLTYQDRRPLKGFVNFDCTKSYVLADSTGEFNCIGWAVGVKEFIDPTQKINKYYDKKTETGMITVQFHSAPSPSQMSLHEYQKVLLLVWMQQHYFLRIIKILLFYHKKMIMLLWVKYPILP